MSSILKVDKIQKNTGTSLEVVSPVISSPVINGVFDGWVSSGETWVYDSADSPTFTFKVAADVTGKYSPGMRIKLTQTTVKYFIITAISAYSGGYTTITVYGGTDYTLIDATISSNYYSVHKAPFGFPLNSTKWSVLVTNASRFHQENPVAGQYYTSFGTGGATPSITIPIGLWNVSYNICAATYYSTMDFDTFLTLSTSTASPPIETDADFTVMLSAYRYTASPLTKSKQLNLTSKQTYYILLKCGGSAQTIYLMNDYSKMIIQAECVYL